MLTRQDIRVAANAVADFNVTGWQFMVEESSAVFVVVLGSEESCQIAGGFTIETEKPWKRIQINNPNAFEIRVVFWAATSSGNPGVRYNNHRIPSTRTVWGHLLVTPGAATTLIPGTNAGQRRKQLIVTYKKSSANQTAIVYLANAQASIAGGTTLTVGEKFTFETNDDVSVYAIGGAGYIEVGLIETYLP